MSINEYYKIKRKNLLYNLETCAEAFAGNLGDEDFDINLIEPKLSYLILSIKFCLTNGIKRAVLTSRKQSFWKTINSYSLKWPKSLWESIEIVNSINPKNVDDNKKMLCWILDGLVKNSLRSRIAALITTNTTFLELYDNWAFIRRRSFKSVLQILKKLERFHFFVDIRAFDYSKYLNISTEDLFFIREVISENEKNLILDVENMTVDNSDTNKRLSSSISKLGSTKRIRYNASVSMDTSSILIPEEKIMGIETERVEDEFSQYCKMLQETIHELKEEIKLKDQTYDLTKLQIECIFHAMSENIECNKTLILTNARNNLKKLLCSEPYKFHNLDNFVSFIDEALLNNNITQDPTQIISHKTDCKVTKVEATQSEEKLETETRLKNQIIDFKFVNLDLRIEQLNLRNEILSQKQKMLKLEQKLNESEKAMSLLACKHKQIMVKNVDMTETLCVVENSEWVPDKLVNDCTLCQLPFNAKRRKHHCRRCGKIFCKKCSNNFVELMKNTQNQRVCDMCFGSIVSKK